MFKNKSKKQRVVIAAIAVIILAGFGYLVVASVQNTTDSIARDRTAVTQTRQTIRDTCKPGMAPADCWQLTSDDLSAGDNVMVRGKVAFGDVCTLDVTAPVDDPTKVSMSLLAHPSATRTVLVSRELSKMTVAQLKQSRQDYGLGYCFMGDSAH